MNKNWKSSTCVPYQNNSTESACATKEKEFYLFSAFSSTHSKSPIQSRGSVGQVEKDGARCHFGAIHFDYQAPKMLKSMFAAHLNRCYDLFMYFYCFDLYATWRIRRPLTAKTLKRLWNFLWLLVSLVLHSKSTREILSFPRDLFVLLNFNFVLIGCLFDVHWIATIPSQHFLDFVDNFPSFLYFFVLFSVLQQWFKHWFRCCLLPVHWQCTRSAARVHGDGIKQ